MNKLAKWGILCATALSTLLIAGTAQARHDDECLELGWRDQNGHWTFYRTHILEYHDGGRVHMSYEFNRGELDLRFKEHDDDGESVTVAKGKWREPDASDGNPHWGKVFLKFEEGHHWAKGWFTYGEDETHYDMALRDCKR